MTKNSNSILQVLVNNKPVQHFHKDNSWYIAGKPGTEYKIRINNPFSSRVEAVVSVDGIDVISGKTAGSECKGYIIQPFGSIDIEGFRISETAIRSFVFDTVDNSYAAKKAAAEGSTAPLNVGIIGCILYKEKPYTFSFSTDPIFGASFSNTVYNLGNYDIAKSAVFSKSSSPTRSVNLSHSVGEASSANCTVTTNCVGSSHQTKLNRNDVGTKMGDKKESKISYVEFIRDETTKYISALYYKTLENLVEEGIVSKNNTITAGKPNPFPNDINYFCPEY